MAIVAAGLIWTISNFAHKGWPLMWPAIAASIALVAGVFITMFTSVLPLVDRIKNLPYNLNADYGKMQTLSWITAGVILAGGALAWAYGAIEKIVSKLKKGVKWILGLLVSSGVGVLTTEIMGSFTDLGGGSGEVKVTSNGNAYNHLPKDDPNYQTQQELVEEYNRQKG
jgi:predicted PurR-regulated permease PerM